MLGSSVPLKFPVAFASSAPPGTGIRAIPTSPGPVPGAAALTTGFPPLTFLQPSVGGIPPDGRDVNGILNQLSAWAQWSQAGGPIGYDSAFAAAIGGYPRGALVMSTSGHAWYECLVDNNFADPNAGFTNWRVAFSPWSTQAWVATGSANAQLLTLSPAPTSVAQLTGIPIQFISQGTSTGPVTFNINALGAFQLLQSNGPPLGAGALVSGGSYTLRFNGAGFFLISSTTVFTDANPGSVAISGINNTSGANLALFGNGGTTPNKYIRARAGSLEVVNNAYSNVIASLTDAGAFAITSTLSAANAVITGSFSANTIVGNTVNSNGSITAGTGISGNAISSVSNITAGTGISTTSGNIVANNGSISAATTITAGTGINSTSGNIVANNGNVSASGSIGAGAAISAGTGITSTSGNIVANAGRLRAGQGAYLSGDPNVAALLGDFFSSIGNPGFIRFPNGLIFQWGNQILNGNGTILTTFPFAFPTACYTVLCSEGAGSPSTWGSNAPTLHASGGVSNSQWAHWGLQWNGAAWALSNLTTAWWAVGV